MDLVVNLGDEVRWVNARSLPIQVDLVRIKRDDLSCEGGFSNLLGTYRKSATINPNDSTSACFSAADAVSYNVSMESALPGGKKTVPGVVSLGEMKQ